jgi:predicted lipase
MKMLQFLSLLALVALALASPTHHKRAISQDVYNNLVRYAQFSAAAYYYQPCPNPNGARNVYTINNAVTDQQGYIAVDDAKSEIILVFRGTNSLEDYVLDKDNALVPYVGEGISCTASNCTVVHGYWIGWESIRDDVVNELTTLISTYPSYTITVTGHSLGAGLAGIGGTQLAGIFPRSKFNPLYTYGEPRCGPQDFADYVNKIWGSGNIYRCTHTDDGVPQANLYSEGFRHHSEEYWSQDPQDAADVVTCGEDEVNSCNGAVGQGKMIDAAHLNYFNVPIGLPITDVSC